MAVFKMGPFRDPLELRKEKKKYHGPQLGESGLCFIQELSDA